MLSQGMSVIHRIRGTRDAGKPVRAERRAAPSGLSGDVLAAQRRKHRRPLGAEGRTQCALAGALCQPKS